MYIRLIMKIAQLKKHLRELSNKINGLALLMEMARLLNYANFGYLWGHVKS